MKTKIILAGLSLFLISLPAHAIPPPDVVISLWQSVLQFMGVASVFIGGAILSVRQFFGHYIEGNRPAFFTSLQMSIFEAPLHTLKYIYPFSELDV